MFSDLALALFFHPLRTASYSLLLEFFFITSAIFSQIPSPAQIQKKSAPEQITIEAIDGIKYSGGLYFTDSSGVVIQHGADRTNGIESFQSARFISCRRIRTIIFPREGKFIQGFYTGGVIGGAAGALIGFASGDDEKGFMAFTAAQKAGILGLGFGAAGALAGGIVGAVKGIDDNYFINGNCNIFQTQVTGLKKKSAVQILPPAISLAAESDAFPSEVQSEDVPQVPNTALTSNRTDRASTADNFFGRFRLTGRLKLHYSRANRDITDAFDQSGFGGTSNGWFGSTSYPVDVSNSFSYDVEAAYRLSPTLRFGAGCYFLPLKGVNGIDGENENLNGKEFGFFAEWNLLQSNYLEAQNVEARIGGGITINRSAVDGSLRIYYSYNSAPSFFSFSKTSAGLSGRFTISYCISQNITFELMIRGTVFPSFSLPDQSYSYQRNQWQPNGIQQIVTVEKRLAGHQVDISSIDISAGVGFGW